MLARAGLIGALIVASSPLALAAYTAPKPSRLIQAATYNPNASYSYRILSTPTSSDERAIRNLGLQPEAQRRSNRLFGALQSLLGGTAPTLNFTPHIASVSGGEVHLSATPAKNAVNIDPYATEGLINNAAATHSGAVNQIPHEMAHLRQIAEVLASIPVREGGAQAFADTVTPVAARRAGIPYQDDNFDSNYSDYVHSALAKGRDWILAGQFGKPGSPAWP